MSVANNFLDRWRSFRFPDGRTGFVGTTGQRDHFMLLAGGLWTSFGVGRPFFLPWIVRDNSGHGNFTGMVHLREGERHIWAKMKKLVRADCREDRPFCRVDAGMEYTDGENTLTFSARFTFAAGFSGFLVEPTGVENHGKNVLNLDSVYFFANTDGEEKVKPLPDRNGWLYPDGRKIVVTQAEGCFVNFGFDRKGHPHADVKFKTPGTRIPPGGAWTPSVPMAAVYEYKPFTEDGE